MEKEREREKSCTATFMPESTSNGSKCTTLKVAKPCSGPSVLQQASMPRSPWRRLRPLLPSAEVAHNIFVFTHGAVRSALPWDPALRGNASPGKAFVFAKAASVPAAINARPTEGRGILGKGYNGQGH